MSDTLTPSGDHQKIDFVHLVEAIRTVDERLSVLAARAVNTSLTIRNWLIGFRIQEYEQHGSDRAGYGHRLIDALAEELQAVGVSRSEPRELRRYRLFYQCYPQIRESLTPEFRNLLTTNNLGTTPTIRESLTPISGSQLISSLSYTHICELLRCDSGAKRAFYESECIRG